MSDLRNAIKLAIYAGSAASTAAVTQPAFAQDALEEITVTATRREQSITDVPYNISAVTGETIANAGVTNMADLMRQVPGVTFLDTGARGNSVNSSIVLRGVNLNSSSAGAAVPNTAVPAVSTYLNDTPTFVNLKLLDINRVEVLRGPQGTLYGSGSLAGTVRFIFNDPDYENTTFSANASIESLGESDDNTYSVEAVANFPIGDHAAFRIAAAYEDIGGIVDAHNIYVTDNNGQPVLQDPNDTFLSPGVTQSIEDYDTSEMAAFRATYKTDLSDTADLTLSWHHQDLESSGDNFRDQGSDAYVFSQNARVNTMDLTADAAALEVEADLGFATLTSSTSYANVDYDSRRDLTYLALFLDSIDAPDVGITPCFFYGCYPRQLLDAFEPTTRTDKTQEFRLVSNTDGNVDWIVGLYYNENEVENQQLDISQGYAEWASDPAWLDILGGITLAQLLPYYGVSDPTTVDSQFFQHRQADFTDTALFGEVTYHVSDRWQITGGARFYSQEYDLAFYQEFSNCGAFCSQDEMNPLGLVDLRSKTDDDDVLWKFNTSFDVTDEANVYFNFSQGFRRGGANGAFVSTLLGIPESALTYGSDSGDNYEIGIKGTLAGTTRYTLAYYVLDWKNAQIDEFEPNTGIQIVTNLAEARTQGLEAELAGNVGDNFAYSLGYNYTKAEVSQTDQPYPFAAPVVDGTPLPGTAENQVNAAGDYYFPLAGGRQIRLHADAFYRSSAPNALLGVGEPADDLPSFTLVNASINLESDNGWSVGLFGRNIFDERNAMFARGRPDFAYLFDAAARPRSYGIRASWRFE